MTIIEIRTLLDIADRLEYTALATARHAAGFARIVAGLRALIDAELDELDRPAA